MENQKKPEYKLKWYCNLYFKFFPKKREEFDTRIQRALVMRKHMDSATKPRISHFYNEKGQRIREMVDASRMKYSPNRSHPLYKHAHGIPQNSHPLLEKYGQ